MQESIVFKGMTRPPLLFGVPLTPLITVAGILFLISLWFNIYIMFSIVPIYLIMKFLSSQDDFIFRLLFLKMRLLTPTLNKKYYGVKTFTTTEYREMSRNSIFPQLSIFGLNKNPSLEKFLPYSSLLKEDIVITKDFHLLSTWSIKGIAFETEDDTKLDFNKNVLNMLFKSFTSEELSFYVHSVRHDINTKLDSKFNNNYLKDIDELYFKSFGNNTSKQVDLYLTVVYNPFINKIEKSNHIKSKLDKKKNNIENFIKLFYEFSNRIEANLKRYNPKKLKIYTENDCDYSKQLEFYNYLIGGRFTKTRALNAPLNEYLTGGLKNIQFDFDVAQLNYTDGNKKFSRTIEIKEYSSTTHIGILNTLMYLNVNYTLTQSFVPLKRSDAKEKLKRQQKQFQGSEDDSITQEQQFFTALDDLTNGDICFGDYHFSLVIFGDDIKEVKDNTNKVVSTLQDIGLTVTLADIALPSSYFAQFPSNYALRTRVSAITSKNFSDLVSLHNFPSGRSKNNPWGDAITVLKTPSKQPYYFNIHAEKSKNDFAELTLANNIIIGQSGGGKTAFMNLIACQLLKFTNIETFPNNIEDDKKIMSLIYLDKDYGAMGNILSAGGRYLSIKNGVETGFNPFMIENTEENKRNLEILLKILVTSNGETLKVSEERMLSNAVNFIIDFIPIEDRKFGISLLMENLTDDNTDENSLKQRFSLWQKGSKYGWVFDNENDSLNFPDDINFFGIDGTEFLDDKDVCSPISFYILWKVTKLIDGRRFGLIIDEFWQWLGNDLIQQEVFNKLKTIRKQNGFISMASQSVEDVLKLPIARAIVEQTSTHIFFPNERAKKEDYVEGLSCTDEEFEIIKTFNPATYPFLIKRSKESVIVNLDLSSIGSENISILSTGTAYKDKVEEIFNEEINLDKKVKKLQKFYKNI